MSTTELLVLVEGKYPANLSLAEDGLHYVSEHTHSNILSATTGAALQRIKKAKTRVFPFLDVLNASFNSATRTLVIRLLSHEDGHTKLPYISAQVPEEHATVADYFVSDLMERAYQALFHDIRIHQLISYFGRKSGKGKGRATWAAKIRPLLAAAVRLPLDSRSLAVYSEPRVQGCTVDYEETTHSGHAKEIASKLDLTLFDALVIVSGDGLVAEALNGLASRTDVNGLQIPFGVIPSGSGNALAINLMGPTKITLGLAALNVLKGSPMPLSLCEVTQGKESYYSFLSISFGLIADCDLGTDAYRVSYSTVYIQKLCVLKAKPKWIGETRFVLGYVAGVMSNRAYPSEIELQIVDSDRARIMAPLKGETSPPVVRPETHESLPWTKLPASTIAFLFAGLHPWMGSDLLPFPAAGRPDGCLDLVIMGTTSRKAMLTALDGSETGDLAHPDLSYYKVKGLRLKPKKAKENRYLSVDGESVPCTEIEMKFSQREASVLGFQWAKVETKKWSKGATEKQ